MKILSDENYRGNMVNELGKIKQSLQYDNAKEILVSLGMTAV